MSRDDSIEGLVARLWTPVSPARRGPKPTLSVERIIDAALDIADAEGIEAVSMSRLGKALGVTPMALYRHLSGKEELLARLTDAIAADMPEIPVDQGWRPGLEVWVRVQIEYAMRRPWMLDLPLSTVPPGPHRLRWIDRAFGLMAGLPLDAGEKLGIIGILAQHVLGESRVQVEAARADEDPFADLGLVLARYADPSAYPHLIAAMSASKPAPGPPHLEDDIAWGIEVVLDGVEAYLARKAEAAERGDD